METDFGTRSGPQTTDTTPPHPPRAPPADLLGLFAAPPYEDGFLVPPLLGHASPNAERTHNSIVSRIAPSHLPA